MVIWPKSKNERESKSMKKAIFVFVIALLVTTMTGCVEKDVVPDDGPEVTAEPAMSYIIEEDYKEGNGLSFITKAYQIGEWIYLAEFNVIYQINVNGTGLEYLFTADQGLIRGVGADNLTQCKDYLLFTQGSYIYKMNLSTLKTEVLLQGKKENTCIEISVKDDEVYFLAKEGSYRDGIYKISVDGGEPTRIINFNGDPQLFDIQVADNKIFYTRQQKGLYSVDLDGSNNKKILKAKYISTHDFIVKDGYVYAVSDDCVLRRADINGNDITKLVSKCVYFNIVDDYIIYTQLNKKAGYYSGKDLYKMPLGKDTAEKIYTGEVECIFGISGNWIYFVEPGYSNLIRVRLDGSGKMNAVH